MDHSIVKAMATAKLSKIMWEIQFDFIVLSNIFLCTPCVFRAFRTEFFILINYISNFSVNAFQIRFTVELPRLECKILQMCDHTSAHRQKNKTILNYLMEFDVQYHNRQLFDAHSNSSDSFPSIQLLKAYKSMPNENG